MLTTVNTCLFLKKCDLKNIFVIGKYLYKQRISIKPPLGCKAIVSSNHMISTLYMHRLAIGPCRIRYLMTTF